MKHRSSMSSIKCSVLSTVGISGPLYYFLHNPIVKCIEKNCIMTFGITLTHTLNFMFRVKCKRACCLRLCSVLYFIKQESVRYSQETKKTEAFLYNWYIHSVKCRSDDVAKCCTFSKTHILIQHYVFLCTALYTKRTRLKFSVKFLSYLKK